MSNKEIKDKKKKNNNIFVYLLVILLAGSVSGILSYFDVFQKLDYRIYDLLIQTKKDPEVDNKIVLVEIDDPSINELGEWPWSRDIIADVLFRLKEFDASLAVFDIEYISPSKMGIAPSAQEVITGSVASVENTINQNIGDLSNAIQNNYLALEDLPYVLDDMSTEVVNPSFDQLEDYILNESFRDNDEYFAKALQFFGNSQLTINNVDLKYVTPQEDIDYIHNRLLYKNVTDKKNIIPKNNAHTFGVMYPEEDHIGFSPAMNKLMTRCNGVGFTNSFVDTDGVRRRMEMLYKHGDGYLAQLALNPYLKIVKSDDIEINRKNIVIRNAVKDGVTRNLKIPLDNYGSILVNWTRGVLNEVFQNVSIVNILLLDDAESNIVNCLKFIVEQGIRNDDGSEMDFVSHAEELLNSYYDITDYKAYLMSKCTGYDENNVPYDGISDEEYAEYFALRKNFFLNVEDYLDRNYMDSIVTRLNELKDIYDEDTLTSVQNDFDGTLTDIRKELDSYNDSFNTFSTLLKGSYCIFGNTAASTTDLGATPFEKKFENVGIHASVLNTLLQEDYIYYIDWYWGFIISVLFSLFMLLFINKSNTFQNVFNGVLSLILIFISGVIFRLFNSYIPSIGFILFIVTNYIAGVIYRFILSSREKRFITQVAASFANKDTVEQLRKNPELFTTKGEKKYITALFTDIQKFSTFSESITKIYGEEGANKLILHLNDYLGAMSDEILKNSGNIDKYEGDAIISMFGAPDPMNLHTKEEWSYLSLDSAIKMKKIEAEFDASHTDLFKTYEIKKEDGTVEKITLNPFKTRIGINSGESFVGLMGSKTDSFTKLNYTMIGDTVNLAARLEGVNKAYGSWILCSEDTWKLANTGTNYGKITAKRLDKVRVVGRSTPVQLYNIVGFTNELTPVQLQEIDLFHTALDNYLNREFVTAGKMFVQASSMIGEDPTALIFANRCKGYIENGCPDDWDGVISMTSK